MASTYEELYEEILNGNSSVSYDTMQDEHSPIVITEKTADVSNVGVITKGESYSNMLTFSIDRYYDGIDLSDKKIVIIYKNGDTLGVDFATNLSIINETTLKFAWVLTNTSTWTAGELIASVQFVGNNENGEDYILKTLPFTLTINNTLDIVSTDTIINGEAVIELVQYVETAMNSKEKAEQAATTATEQAQKITELVSEMSDSVTAAATSATAAAESQENASTSATEAAESAASAASSLDKITSMENAITCLARTTQRNITSLVEDGTFVKAISSGNFLSYNIKDGDYFIGENYKYILAHYNYFYGSIETVVNSSMTTITTNHYSIIVDTSEISAWSAECDTSLGYSGSTLHSFLSNEVLTNIVSDFATLGGLNILSHYQYYTSNCSEDLDYPTQSNGNENQQIAALTESQVYGCIGYSTDKNSMPYNTGICTRKLNVFNYYNHNQIIISHNFWLRDIASYTSACFASSTSCPSQNTPETTLYAVGLISIY